MYRVLIVDDEPSMLELMRIAFEQDGFAVQTAKSSYEAMARLLEQWPDAVVVGDLRPLSVASCNLVNDIRYAFAGLDMAVVMVSTQARPLDITVGLAAGANQYLTKPFRLQALVFTVLELIARRSAA
ncbi:MAG: response regulator transcription factor [Candidatus Kerfeldbacteria bacterium]|nr:response regulator transcription factor [Candidatus Kerfeldbacteria bacterium]